MTISSVCRLPFALKRNSKPLREACTAFVRGIALLDRYETRKELTVSTLCYSFAIREGDISSNRGNDLLVKFLKFR